jgi:hypothetical protein
MPGIYHNLLQLQPAMENGTVEIGQKFHVLVYMLPYEVPREGGAILCRQRQWKRIRHQALQ